MGYSVDVYQESINKTFTEYLVNFDFFIDIMKNNGFKLALPKGNMQLFRKEYFENGLGQFGKVIENLPELRRSDEVFRKFYSEAYEMNTAYNSDSPLTKLSSFNNYFIFQKV